MILHMMGVGGVPVVCSNRCTQYAAADELVCMHEWSFITCAG